MFFSLFLTFKFLIFPIAETEMEKVEGYVVTGL